MREWSLREVMKGLSALVNASLAGEPLLVSRRGKPAVVVLAAEEYERLRSLEKEAPPTFGRLLGG